MGRKKKKRKRTKYSNRGAKKSLVKANELFKIAFQYHQTGQLQDAKALYCQILQIIPNHSDALHMYGVLAYQVEKFDVSANLIRKAIAINPRVPDYHSNLSLTIRSVGKLEEAIACCKRAIELKPDYAEAYNNMGVMFKDEGKPEEAISCYQKAVQLKPDYAEAYCNMGVMFKTEGKVDEAIRSFKHVIELDQENATAKHLLAALTGKTPENAPRQYVKDLFDQYSKRFDYHLVEKLEYRTPALLRKSLNSLFEDSLHFQNAIDLGCGTGLSGMEFRSVSDRLTGLDISPKMLQVAKNKKIYDAIQHVDIVDYLNITNEKYDLFIATDVFIYIGNLKPVFQSIQNCSLNGAYLIFSTESTNENSYVLRQTGRYAHPLPYIELLAKQHDFVIEMSSQKVIRKEKEKKIMGNLFILKGNI